MKTKDRQYYSMETGNKVMTLSEATLKLLEVMHDTSHIDTSRLASAIEIVLLEPEAVRKETIARTCEWMRNHNAGEEVIEQYIKDMEE